MHKFANQFPLSTQNRLKSVLSPLVKHYHLSAPSLLSDSAKSPKYTVYHVALFSRNRGNAGDVLLPVVLEDLVSSELDGIRWKRKQVHDLFDDKSVQNANRTDGVVIGGGGLFLSDTNPNSLSGWQWSCSFSQLEKLAVPIVVFAVGYNRFREQADFAPIFSKHVTALARKSTYIGLRNHGSIRSIAHYLPDDLHNKLRFQPCMTTLLSRIYPSRFTVERKIDNCIALNCAFDRSHLRYGEQIGEILQRVAGAVRTLSADYRILYYAHVPEDEQFLAFLNAYRVPYDLHKLYQCSSEEIIAAYQRPSLVIGMRGHAQLIPFGCNTPIISIHSHDKMKWFLEDIGHEEWGVEIQDPRLDDTLVEKVHNVFRKYGNVQAELFESQSLLWSITQQNICDIDKAFEKAN